MKFKKEANNKNEGTVFWLTPNIGSFLAQIIQLFARDLNNSNLMQMDKKNIPSVSPEGSLALSGLATLPPAPALAAVARRLAPPGLGGASSAGLVLYLPGFGRGR